MCWWSEEKWECFPSVTDSMSFNFKFGRAQRLGVYTIGYKYMKCNVLKKYMCVHQFEHGDDLSHFATFTMDIHVLEPQPCQADIFAGCPCWKRNIIESIGLRRALFPKPFSKQDSYVSVLCQLRSNWCRYMKLSL